MTSTESSISLFHSVTNKNKPRRSVLALSGFAACLAIASCSSSEGTGISVGQGDHGTSITEVHLKNGTPCLVMDARQDASLSCRWNAPKETTSAHFAVGDGGTTITEVYLRDGTFCANMDGRSAVAIDCDWNGLKGPITGKNPHGDGGTTIHEVVLPDGARCAVMDGPHSKDQSCSE